MFGSGDLNSVQKEVYFFSMPVKMKGKGNDNSNYHVKGGKKGRNNHYKAHKGKDTGPERNHFTNSDDWLVDACKGRKGRVTSKNNDTITVEYSTKHMSTFGARQAPGKLGSAGSKSVKTSKYNDPAPVSDIEDRKFQTSPPLFPGADGDRISSSHLIVRTMADKSSPPLFPGADDASMEQHVEKVLRMPFSSREIPSTSYEKRKMSEHDSWEQSEPPKKKPRDECLKDDMEFIKNSLRTVQNLFRKEISKTEILLNDIKSIKNSSNAVRFVKPNQEIHVSVNGDILPNASFDIPMKECYIDLTKIKLPSGEEIEADSLIPKVSTIIQLPMDACKNRTKLRVAESHWIYGPDLKPVLYRASTCEKAFVSLHYGDNPLVLAQALMLGCNIRMLHPNIEFDAVLMVIEGSRSENTIKMLSCFWSIQLVREYYPQASWMPKNDKRNWSRVFAKLWAFELIQYEKILFLDTDIMIRQNLSALFSLDTPCGVVWGKHKKFPKAGEPIPDNIFFDDNNGKRLFQINAGAMLLKLSIETANSILRSLSSHKNEDTNVAMPEQAFLTKYVKGWKSLGFQNMTPNQLKPRSWDQSAPYEKVEMISNCSIIHFAGFCDINENPVNRGFNEFDHGSQIFSSWIRIFDERARRIDDFYANTKVTARCKDFVAGHLDPRSEKNARKRVYNAATKYGVELRTTMPLVNGAVLQLCFDYNSDNGCKKDKCAWAHRCRGPYCNYALHSYCDSKCAHGRVDGKDDPAPWTSFKGASIFLS